LKKQSQFAGRQIGATSSIAITYGGFGGSERQKAKPIQSQFQLVPSTALGVEKTNPMLK
jgi:hypothetical protein